MISASRAGLTASAIALAAILTACAEPPAPKSAPPPPPPIALAPKLIEQASAYRYYMDRASAIAPGFVDGPAIAQAMKTGASYEPKQFLQGAISYGAVVALQDPAFVAGVRVYAGTAEQRPEQARAAGRQPAGR